MMDFKRRIDLIDVTMDPANLEPLKNYTEVLHDRKHSKELWIYTLMAMTNASGSFFRGKKLAVLGNGTIALVSMQAKVGDGIWSFNGDGEGLCSVLRSYVGDEGAGLVKKKGREGENNDRAEMDRTFKAFFREEKREVMERYVECRDDGRIVWNKGMLNTNMSMRFMGETAYQTIRNSSLRAARALAKLKSEGNYNGGRERKELKENLKRKMEMVVGNVLKEMHDTRHNDGNETRDVMLLRTDVDGIGMMERGVVKHVRFVGECVVEDEWKSNGRKDEYDNWEKKCQEVKEEMREWWKLGLGVPSEILDGEGEYDEGEYDRGYKGRGYDLEEWEAESENLKVISSQESYEENFSDESDVDSYSIYSSYSDHSENEERESARMRRYMEANRWERLVLPLRNEILAIH